MKRLDVSQGSPAGLYRAVSESDYHADPCPAPSLSASTAHTLLSRSPRHAWFGHPKLNPDAPLFATTPAMDLGSALHQLFLEQRVDGIEVIAADDWRTKAAKKQRDAARAAGKVPLLADKFEEAVRIVAAARAQITGTELASAFGSGCAEVTACWQEGDTWLRGRLDWLTDDLHLVVDYKTTETSAEPDAFARRILAGGMDIQAAMYVRAVKAITGIEPRFVFVVQEVEPPYLLSLIGLTPQWMAFGAHKLHRAIETWRECLRTDTWPGYPSRVAWLELPAWAEAAAMAKELEDA